MYEHHSENGTNTATKPKSRVHDVLLEVDGWRLVRPLYPSLVETDSYVVHWDCVNPDMAYRARTWVDKGGLGPENKCTKCDQKCPDEIAGMYILHNGKI